MPPGRTSTRPWRRPSTWRVPRGGSTWVKPAFDTIFFLSDGRATIGLSTNSEEILALLRERNANAGIVLHDRGCRAPRTRSSCAGWPRKTADSTSRAEAAPMEAAEPLTTYYASPRTGAKARACPTLGGAGAAARPRSGRLRRAPGRIDPRARRGSLPGRRPALRREPLGRGPAGSARPRPLRRRARALPGRTRDPARPAGRPG